MEKSKRIRRLLPLVNQIRDEKLRNGVVKVWVKAWEESEWEDAADCPFSPEIKGCSLIEHVNFVTAAALAMAANAKEVLHVKVDTDLLLAGALLHDVSKVVEYAPEAGKPGKPSAIGEDLLHGSYGVHLALNAGLPLRVAHLISSHTPKASQLPRVVEGIFICYADYAAADAILQKNGLPLILKR